MFTAKYTAAFIDENFHSRAKDFWNYFIENHTIIEEKINNRNKDFIKDFEINLKKVFKNYDKPLRFTFKKEDSKYVFIIYYGYNSYLLTLADALFEMKKESLQQWTFLSQRRYK